MAFGEEVGDAYIEVHADSRPFRRELRRDARRAGREAGSEIGDGLSEGIDSELDDAFAPIGQRLRRQMTRAGFRAGEGFGENMMRSAESRLKRWNLDLGDALLTGDFEKVVGVFDDLDTAMARIDHRLVSLRRAGRLTADEFKDARTSLEAWGQAIRDGKVAEELNAAHDAASRLNTEMNRRDARENQRDLLSTIRGIGKALAEDEREYDRLHATAIKVNQDINRGHEQQIRNLRDVASIKEDMNRGDREFHERAVADRLEFFNQEIDGWLKTRKAAVAFQRDVEHGMRALQRHFRQNPLLGDDAIDRDAWERALLRVETGTETIVRRMIRNTNTGMLGSLRGARNNFVNLVGIVGGNIENLVGRGLGSAFDAVGGSLSKLGDKLTDFGGGSGPLALVGDGIGRLGEGITGLGKGGIDGLVVQLVLLALTMQGVVVAIGPLVSGIAGLAGILTALAVTIGGAVLGAIGSLLPIMAALGIAVGAGVIGVMGMTDAMKDMLGPLEAWFDRVKTTVAANLFGNLQSQVERLTGFLDTAVTPALETAARSLSTFMDGFIDMLNSPGVQQSMAIFRDHLPGILGNLGRIFTSVWGGITGVIAAAAPVVEAFLGYIADIADAFSTWANSDAGRAEIRDFFEKAAVAAQTLFDIVGSLAGIFSTLWEEGSDTGQAMLDTFADALETFNGWLGTKEGREELSSWFQYAEELAGKLGDILGSLGELWDALDTPMNRELFLVFLDGVNGLIGALTWMATTGEDFILTVAGAFASLQQTGEDFSGWLDELLDFDWDAIWNTITSPFTTAWDWIVTFFTEKPAEIETFFHDLFDIDWAAVGQTILTGLSTALTVGLTALFTVGIQIIDWFIQLPGQIMTALSSLGSIIGGIFTGIWTYVIPGLAVGITTVLTFFMNLPGQIWAFIQGLPALLGGLFTTAWNAVTTAVSTGVSAVLTFISQLPGRIMGFLSSLPGTLSSLFSTAWNSVLTTTSGIVSGIIGFVSGIPGKIGSALSSLWSTVKTAFSTAWNSASTETQQRISSLVTTVGAIPGKVYNALSGIGSKLVSRGRELIEGLIQGVAGAVGRIASTISNAISNIRLPSIQAPKINMPQIPKINWPWTASGGIFNGAQGRIIGEAGPEAVVPLNRPLSQVDPAVRSLSAYAQGKGGNTNGSGSGNVTNDIKVFAPYSDPALVAVEVMDALVGRAE